LQAGSDPQPTTTISVLADCQPARAPIGKFYLTPGRNHVRCPRNLDLAVTPSREMATSVLRNFSKMAKSDTVKIHPMITQLVDPEILSKLIVKPGSDDVVASKLN